MRPSFILRVAALALLPMAAHAGEPVKLGLAPTSDFLAAYVALDQGLFRKHGLDVTYVPAMGGTAMPALTAGSFDVLGSGVPSALSAADAGLTLKIIAGGSVLPTFGKLGIVARAGSGINAPADFVGRKVAVSGLNSILHIAARNWLMENGVDPGRVKWVEVQFAQHADVMKGGQVDAAVMTDPFFSRAVDQAVGYAAGPVYEKAPAGVMLGSYVATDDWIARHPAELAAFRAALDDGRRFVADNKPAALESLARYTKLPPDALKLLGFPNLQSTVAPANIDWWIAAMQRQKLFLTDPKAADIIQP
ncbi:ABC transporter substrate-binding protein [Chelatococcus reniformis]|uniref:Sulfonate ABC transporter substrate-binding protein n=1 Tax=Chelatococcus reniformis TaxID=1494448 RepID=A0A916UYY5_9HYPH|nr:ABC transporter substrate-binding protein [Chelatococcus reniformis]GGC92312.1 sulfonate ABC transporter substrate-binding protein [Chelatococcus reniformis]